MVDFNSDIEIENDDELGIDFESVLHDGDEEELQVSIKPREIGSARRRIEDFMELRRLREEFDDPDFMID